MERKNFYLLLELSIEPPEGNSDTIEKAIKKKQIEWSRLRNHPTKGIKAKQYIELIPEIRKVMFDSNLRKIEVENAIAKQGKKDKDKFLELDRHIDIHISKGYVTKEETFKLSKLHKIDEKEILKRISKKNEKKLLKIDKILEVKVSKGYITEEEIKKLAKLYFVSADEIKKRVNCPIKNEVEKDGQKAKALDNSIEKIIVDNLKIVNKSSLYEFLGLSPASSIEGLQKKSLEKDSQVQKISKKDAFATASGVLVGQCISIFKTLKSKQSYDLTRSKGYLDKFNSDIEVAAFEGKIRVEYIDKLIKAASKLGMDRQEAEKYIKDYCKKRKWKIKIPKTSKRFLFLFSIALIVLALGGIVTGAYLYLVNSDNRNKNQYYDALLKVYNTENFKDKEKLLNEYITNHLDSKYAANAKNKLKEIRQLYDNSTYNENIEKVNDLVKVKKFQGAILVLRKFLKKYPKNINKKTINKQIAKISQLIEGNDFEKISKDLDLGSIEKVSQYKQFLKKYPKSKYNKKINKLLADIKEDYYIDLERQIIKYKIKEDWKKCIELAQAYIDIFEGDRHAIKLKQLQITFKYNSKQQKIFNGLVNEANNLGNNFLAAKKVYIDYLKLQPYSPIKNKIEKQLEILNEREMQYKLNIESNKFRSIINNSNNRFVERGHNTFLDKKTKLIWKILDSEIKLGKCIKYQAIKKYIKNLNVKGINKWRLPNKNELLKLYDSGIFYPVVKGRWYWSSSNYKRFSGGWKTTIVDTVVPSENGATLKQEDSWQCGSVRAVKK